MDMSVEEMKIEIINKVIQLKSDEALAGVIEYLDKLNSDNQQQPVNLSNHYATVKQQYGSVLQKLAQ